jgi:predicted DNA-binding protein (UPF0251 family)
MDQEKIERQITEIRDTLKDLEVFLISTDTKTNAEICKAMKISKQTFWNWVNQGCPRESKTHARLSLVKKWRAETVTKK